VTFASTRMLTLSMGCFESAGRQCYSLVAAVPSFLPHRTTLAAREHRTPPPPLPEPKYRIEYVDVRSTASSDETLATLVLVHGAPGNYRDFRYLIPRLAQHPGLRIIGINLPGYGGSTVEKAHYLETVSALRTAEVALDGVRKLCGAKDDIFLVGHSFGANTIVNVAALDLTTNDKALAIRGLALVAPAGCSPHKSLSLGVISLTVKMLLSGNACAVSAATHFTKFVYTKLLRLPSGSPADPFVSAVIRASTTDFVLIRDQATLLGSRQKRTLIAWAQDDEHIQREIPEELAGLCGDGPRLEFTGGGHNLQKTRADEISASMMTWITDVLATDKA
jgi:pimeloyl-ACP methyl ester carboxylesterase